MPPLPQKLREPTLSAKLQCPQTLRPHSVQPMHPIPTPTPAPATPHTAAQEQQSPCCECLWITLWITFEIKACAMLSYPISFVNRWLCQRVGCHHEMTWEAGKRVREQRKKKNRGEATSRLASGTVKGQLLLAFSLRISNAVAPPEAMRLGEARSQSKSKQSGT